MERIHAKGISKEEYTRNFKIKQSDVPYINGRPTWTTINLIQEAIEANLVAMYGARDGKYGKLFLVHNTANLDGVQQHKYKLPRTKEHPSIGPPERTKNENPT